MSRPTILGTGGHHDGSFASGNYYANVGLGRCPLNSAPFTTESYVKQTVRVPGTVSYLSWGLDTAFGSTLTLRLRKNSSNTNLAISIGPLMTGWVTDSTDNVSVADGDTLDFAANVALSPIPISYSGNFNCISARFDAETPSAQLIAAVGASPVSPTTTRQFVNFLGVAGVINAESVCQFNSLADGTWQYKACYIEPPNNFDKTTTINNRVNANNGSMAISVTGGSSGYFEDVGIDNYDSVNAGDKLDYGLIASEDGNGSDFTMAWIGAHFFTTGPCMIGGSTGGTAFIGDTEYSSLFGGGQIVPGVGTSIVRSTGLVPFALNASSFTNYVTDNTDGTATLSLLVNGSPSLAVTIHPGDSGYITDNSTVSIAVGDTCANDIAVSSGTISWASASLLVTAS